MQVLREERYSLAMNGASPDRAASGATKREMRAASGAIGAREACGVVW